MSPSLLRIVVRLGPSGAETLIRRSLDLPELSPFVARLRLPAPGCAPADALHAVLRGRPSSTLRADLDQAAGLLAAWPEVIARLWGDWDAPCRVTALQWLTDWLPLGQARLVHRGLDDPSPEVRIAAARLATLLPVPDAIDRLAALARGESPEERIAAAHAIAAQRVPAARAPLHAALADPNADVALAAALGLLRQRDPGLAAAVASAPALADDVRGRLLTAVGTERVEAALAALDDPNTPVRFLAMRLLGLELERDPRARERLIRLADARDRDDRASAVAALAAVHDPTAGELLARAIREPPSRETLLRLQEAAQDAGDSALVPLARRMRADPPGRLDVLLAVLRAQPYAAAVPPMLRALEATRGRPAEGLIAATLFAGGAEVHAAIQDGLRQPGRGLLTPALGYLAAYSSEADLPLLVDLFDRHPPLRGILLNLIEGHGEAARRALAARVAQGGDDAMLTAVESRIARLDACLDPG